MADRYLGGYIDAVHHLAWLATQDHDEQAHGGFLCPGGDACPLGWSFDALSDVSASCDGPKVASPSDYVRAALDLLWLAATDETSPKRARELREAIATIEDIRRREVRRGS